MTTDAYSDWDAAYVLGALAATDRREFERHLAGCAECSAAVAELAGLPGLLAKVPVGEVEMSERSPLPVPQTLLPRLVRSVARRRRRSRALVVGSILAAAATAAAIVLAVPLILPTPPAVTSTGSASAISVVLTPVESSPLYADVKLVPEGWGTRLELNCRYDATASTPPGYSRGEGAGYAMFVTDASGRSMQVATWTATPGSTVEPAGTTSLAVADISSVDIRSGSDGRVLLSGSP
ncbi:anti-sigma factor [Glaciihabitans sp. INWT7]|uniref:anti-sigma factor family protein n=1 Tax=Glaciihabitans sp. INWT7 TaxID=2596912 RepID=UPI0016248915|nr:zf-HC2 domain-containing protein [Glaciihabitans sp. INWT7]QNE47235.1 anti-sigma factor [Glaciihabitans sp. INWT7]